MTDLDAADLRLLAALQRQGRASNILLGEAIGASASQVSRRLARLEEAGVIEGYAALLKPEAVGLTVMAVSLVSLERHAEAVVHDFEAFVAAAPEILDCYAITGEADFVLRVVVADLAALADLISRRLLRLAGIRSVRSSIVLQRIKQTPVLPLRA